MSQDGFLVENAYLNPICVGRDLEWRCICVASGFGLLCMAVIAPLMAWRVIPFFVMRAVTGLQIPMHTVAVSGN